MRTKVLGALVVFFLFWLLGSFTAVAQPEDDPVLEVLEAYDKASNVLREQKNRTREESVTFWREWKKRFQEVVNSNPHNEYIEVIRSELVALSNGLGEYVDSQKIIQEIISQTESVSEKICWHNELGEVSRAEFFTNKDQSEAKKSLDAFEQAYTLYLSLPPEEKTGEIGRRIVVSQCMASDLTGMLGDHEKSATLAQSARKLFQSSTDIAACAVMVGYDLESITLQEMNAWVHAKQESKAIDCLEILSKLRPYRWPPSSYALDYATLRYENDGIQDSKNFQDFVSHWLSNHAFDERTPILMARLGFSYYGDGLYEKALPIYETLRDKHREDFQKLEPDAFEQGSEGHYDTVLSDLAVLYLRQGNFAGAESVKKELTELLPQSRNIEGLTPENFMVDLPPFPQPQQSSTGNLFFKGAFMLLGVVLILLGLYLHFVKKI